MTENLFNAEYDVTKKSKLRKFYDSKKILIYSFIFSIFVIFVVTSLYFENKEKKNILLSDNYLQAKVYLQNGENDKAVKLLKEVIFSNNSTYSTLSLFLLINRNLLKNSQETLDLFEHILEKNKFTKDLENLLIFKKALFASDFSTELEIIEIVRPLLSEDNTWKPHSLLLLGDFFMTKGETIKAIEFYQEVFKIKNLHPDIYKYASFQLAKITNE
jgi:tetratricopeptide (TPR) repeat protein